MIAPPTPTRPDMNPPNTPMSNMITILTISITYFSPISLQLH